MAAGIILLLIAGLFALAMLAGVLIIALRARLPLPITLATMALIGLNAAITLGRAVAA